MRHSSIATTEGYYVHLDAADVADELWSKFGGLEAQKPVSGNTSGNIHPKNDNEPGNAEPVKSYLAKG